MEFYDEMINELIKFNDFVDRAKKDDFSLASVYGMGKNKLHFISNIACTNKRLNLKLLYGCIQKEIWGFFVLTPKLSYLQF